MKQWYLVFVILFALPGVLGDPSALIRVDVETGDDPAIVNVSESYGFPSKIMENSVGKFRLKLITRKGDVVAETRFAARNVITKTPSEEFCKNTSEGYRCEETGLVRKKSTKQFSLPLTLKATHVRLYEAGDLVDSRDVRSFLPRCGDGLCSGAENSTCGGDCTAIEQQEEKENVPWLVWVLLGGVALTGILTGLLRYRQ